MPPDSHNRREKRNGSLGHRAHGLWIQAWRDLVVRFDFVNTTTGWIVGTGGVVGSAVARDRDN